MNSTQIADILQRNQGNLSCKRWASCCGSRESTHVLRWLESIGVAEWQPIHSGRVKRRVLKVSLREAVSLVKRRQYEPPRRKQNGRQPGSQVSESFVVVDDPTGLFKTGNRFPASQIIESGENNKSKWLEPGELPDGMWMTYKGANWVMDPERGLVKVEDDECWIVEDGVLVNKCKQSE